MADDIFTLKEYLNNPDGKGIGLQNIKNQYITELKTLEKDMSISWYTTSKKDVLCAHIILPSQSNETVRYDIVFEFQLGDKHDHGEYLLNYPVRVFTNSPSFVYKYAYMYNKEGRLIPWLKQKYDIATFQKEPSSKNPNKEMRFERSLYLSALYIQNHRDYLPLALSTARVLVNITKIKDYVLAMNELDAKRKQESYLKSQQKLYENKKKEYENMVQRTKSHSTPAKPTQSATSSATKKPKGTSSGVKKPTGVKKPKKGTR